MLTIKKIEVGYGMFEGERLITFVDRQEDYAGLVGTVINVNTKLEIECIKAEIEEVKNSIPESPSRIKFVILKTLKEKLHFLRSYNV